MGNGNIKAKEIAIGNRIVAKTDQHVEKCFVTNSLRTPDKKR